MGCASSAVMPFLSSDATKNAKKIVVGDSAGPPTAKLNNRVLDGNVNNGFIGNAKNINNAFVTEKLDEGINSSAVQNVISGVVEAKDNIVHQLHDVGENVVEKVSSFVEDVEDKFESAFGQTKQTIDQVKEKMGEEVKDIENSTDDKLRQVADSLEKLQEKEELTAGYDGKKDDIDELLAALPDEILEDSKQRNEADTKEDIKKE